MSIFEEWTEKSSEVEIGKKGDGTRDVKVGKSEKRLRGG